MIVFETPGEIDLRAFTTMGLSAKPASSNPIGYFGTGLKYAIAVLARMGADVRVFIGRDEHVFEKAPGEFRGKAYEKLVMRSKRWRWKNWRAADLPFTTEYGRNWKMWQAFRELEANTRDEHGRTWRVRDADEEKPGDSPGRAIEPRSDHTIIVVDHPEFDAAYEKRDEVFLAGSTFESGVGVKIKRDPMGRDLPTASIYWRGLKVYEMGKPSLMTYNIQEYVALTEDRTIANEWHVRYHLARWLVGCDDEKVIERIVTADEDVWEHNLEFDTSIPPSAAFHRVMLRVRGRASGGAWSYYSRHDQSVTERTFNPYAVHKLPWRVEGMHVVDADGRHVFSCPYGYRGKWELVAAEAVKKVNDPEHDPLPDGWLPYETVDEARAAGHTSGTLANGDTFGDEDDGPEGGTTEIVIDVSEEERERLEAEVAIEPPERAPSAVEDSGLKIVLIDKETGKVVGDEEIPF